MNKRIVLLAVVAMFFVSVSSAWAAEDVIETVAKGCEKELTSYCKDVTPGEGRILACLYAHSDKLAGQCEYALYDAAVQLERFVAALTYVANECDADMDKFCADIAVGEGRVLKCLDDNAEKISARCTQALKDVGAE
ncbi:cysteine rich repeat-containing protein [Thermodesulfobacteriota bacterium]